MRIVKSNTQALAVVSNNVGKAFAGANMRQRQMHVSAELHEAATVNGRVTYTAGNGMRVTYTAGKGKGGAK